MYWICNEMEQHPIDANTRCNQVWEIANTLHPISQHPRTVLTMHFAHGKTFIPWIFLHHLKIALNVSRLQSLGYLCSSSSRHSAFGCSFRIQTPLRSKSKSFQIYSKEGPTHLYEMRVYSATVGKHVFPHSQGELSLSWHDASQRGAHGCLCCP